MLILPLIELAPAVCVTPPVKRSASEPLPNVTNPEFWKLTAFVISVFEPSMDTL